MAASNHFLDPRRLIGEFRRSFLERRGSDTASSMGTEKSTEPAERKPRIGIAFSSGGAKGLAHIGVIQVLEENGFSVDAIAGTSMGAYVGGLWASGLSGADLANLAARIGSSKERFKLVDPVFPPRRGFIRGRKIEARLRETLGDKTFDDLKIPTWIVATDLENSGRHVMHSGDVASAIVASLAVPGIVEPVMRDGREYVDGGVAAPLPVNVLREFAGVDKVIAVSVTPTVSELIEDSKKIHIDGTVKRSWWRRGLSLLNRHLNYFAPGNLLSILRNAAMGSQMRLIGRSEAESDLVLRPVKRDAQWHDYHNHAEYIKLGREVAEAALPELKKLFGVAEEEPAKPARNEKTESGKEPALSR